MTARASHQQDGDHVISRYRAGRRDCIRGKRFNPSSNGGDFSHIQSGVFVSWHVARGDQVEELAFRSISRRNDGTIDTAVEQPRYVLQGESRIRISLAMATGAMFPENGRDVLVECRRERVGCSTVGGRYADNAEQSTAQESCDHGQFARNFSYLFWLFGPCLALFYRLVLAPHGAGFMVPLQKTLAGDDDASHQAGSRAFIVVQAHGLTSGCPLGRMSTR